MASGFVEHPFPGDSRPGIEPRVTLRNIISVWRASLALNSPRLSDCWIPAMVILCSFMLYTLGDFRALTSR